MVTCFVILIIKVLYDLEKPYPLTKMIQMDDTSMSSIMVNNTIDVSDEASEVLDKQIKFPKGVSFLEAIAIISDFSRSKIKKGDSGHPCDFEDWNSPLLQQQEFPGDCSAYAKLFVLVANHFGYKSRVAWLFGHVSAEVYSEEQASWLAVDVQNNSMFVDSNSKFVGYSAFVSQNRIDPEVTFYPVRIGKPTLNDPELLKIRKAWHYPKLLVLDSQTVVEYCNMKNNYFKVFLSILGFSSIGSGYLLS